MKKLLLLALIVLGGVMPASATVKVYMKPGTNWSNDNAIFKLYFFQSSDESNNNWTDFTNVVGQDGYYVAEVDNSTYDKMILVRMNPGGTDKSYWERRWNQSWDLDIPTNNSIYYVYDDAGGEATTGSGFGYTSEELNYKIFYGTDKDVVKEGAVTNVDNMDVTDTPYIFTYTFDNTASGSNYFMLLSVSNIGEGNSVSDWNKVFFAEGSGVDNPQLLTFSNGQTGAIVNSSWTRWKIENVPAKFVITFNRIAATWSVAPYFERSISSLGYATFASDYAVAIPTGVTASYATGVTGNEVNLTNFVNGIPANTGALLYKAGGGEITFTPASSTDEVSGNKFVRGSGAAINQTENEGSTTNYILTTATVKGTKTIGFYKANSDNSNTVATDKAYLQLPTASAREFFWFGEEATSINSAETAIQNVEGYYNLSGQRIAQPTKGLYVVNGKKVVIK